MKALTKDVAHHDNPTSKKHARDVAKKKDWQSYDYLQVPALAHASGAKLAAGVTGPPKKGYCFAISAGQAIKAGNDAEYTRSALARSRELRRLPYSRVRNGRATTDYLRRKEGMDSCVFTVAPWAQQTLQRIGPSEREHLCLHLATEIGREVERISGRRVFGGGIHEDTAVLHFHAHVEKTGPKANFLIAGPWNVGAYRIAQKFPSLLTPAKREMLEANLSKKRFECLVDIHVAARIDASLEEWVKERGLWSSYCADCDQYARSKSRMQKNEREQPLMKSALSYFVMRGIWPLAYRIMTLAMFRMIPVELRKPIFLSIRTYQAIKSPTRGKALFKYALEKVREMPPPKMQMH